MKWCFTFVSAFTCFSSSFCYIRLYNLGNLNASWELNAKPGRKDTGKKKKHLCGDT